MDLVERDEPLARLGACVGGLDRGGRVVVVSGEAGVGKTSLLTTFGRSLPSTVVQRFGRCDDLGTPASFGPLWDMAATLPGTVTAPLAEGRRAELFAAVLDELRTQPSMFAVDDVQWADEATIDLLRHVGRRVAELPVLLCLAYRSDEVDRGHPLLGLLGELAGEAERIELRALSWQAVGQLAAGRDDVDLARVYATSRGNPFFVTELLASSGGELPVAVADAVMARTSALPDSAWAVLDAVALAPEGVPLDVLGELGPRADADADAAVGRGLLEVAGQRIRCRHDLVRDVLASRVPPVRRRRVHQHLVDLLADRAATSAEVAQLAHHALAAGDAPRSAEFAVRAGDRAVTDGSHREAARHYATALRFDAHLDAAELDRVLEQYSREAYFCHDMDDAFEASLRLLELRRGDPLTEGRTTWWCSRLAHFADRPDEAMELALAAVELLDGVDDLHEAYARAWVGTLVDDGAAIEHWGLETVALAQDRGELGIASEALNRVALSRWAAGDPTGRQLMLDSLDLAREGRALEQTARAYNNVAYLLMLERDVDEAERWFAEGLAWTSEQDLTFWWDTLVDSRAMLRLFEGDWDGALADVHTVLSSPRGSTGMMVCALATYASVLLRRGDETAGDAAIALRESVKSGSHEEVLRDAVQAEMAWLGGTGVTADLRAMVDGIRRGPVSRRLVDAVVFWLLRIDRDLVADLELGDPEHPVARELTGDRAGAVDAWLQLCSPFEAAVVRAGSDDPDELRAAFEVLGELGATATIAVLRRDAAARGMRTVPRGARPTTREDPLGLTARQSEVLDLLAEGLTNAEIAERLVISAKTAEHHVSAVLAKLGAANRGQAAALARERGNGRTGA